MDEKSVAEKSAANKEELEKLADLTQNVGHVEKHLYSLELQMRSLADVIAEGIFITNTEGLIVYANKAAATIFEYTQEEMVGLHWDNLLPEAFRESMIAHLLEFLRFGKTSILEGTTEFSGLTKSGQIIPLRMTLAANGQGDMACFGAIIHKIT